MTGAVGFCGTDSERLGSAVGTLAKGPASVHVSWSQKPNSRQPSVTNYAAEMRGLVVERTAWTLRPHEMEEAREAAIVIG